MQDYWIGDKIWIFSLNRTGIFEGEGPKGQARVKIDGEHFHHAFDDIQLFDEKEHKAADESQKLDTKPQYVPFIDTSFQSSIDLHIEKLDPSHRQLSVEQILSLQKKACQNFVKNAFAAGRREVVIIHGKGIGVLKKEVRNIILTVDPGAHLEEVNEEGATRVFFS